MSSTAAFAQGRSVAAFRPCTRTSGRAPRRTLRPGVRCNARWEDSSADVEIDRRTFGLGVASVVGSVYSWRSGAAQAAGKETAQVGSYLPAAGIDDFRLFVPDSSKTPAIRAGTVDKQNPYRFAMPPTWREQAVANIQSGNYCQPRCAEPWTEVIFTDSTEGRAQVLVSPLVRLTNAANARIEDIGAPAGLLQSVGSYITGTNLEDEDVVSASSKQLDGRTYYFYECFAPYGTVGPHTLTSMTTKARLAAPPGQQVVCSKAWFQYSVDACTRRCMRWLQGDLLLMLILAANEKQWQKSESKLRKMLETFRA